MFWNDLKEEECSEEDYAFFENCDAKTRAKNNAERQMFYCTNDVLLLACIFEAFRTGILKDFHLDPALFVWLPSASKDASNSNKLSYPSVLMFLNIATTAFP